MCHSWYGNTCFAAPVKHRFESLAQESVCQLKQKVAWQGFQHRMWDAVVKKMKKTNYFCPSHLGLYLVTPMDTPDLWIGYV